MLTPLNPKPLLAKLTGKPVLIKLKWGIEYRGIMVATDAYMNVKLDKTEESVDGIWSEVLGESLIRCNNILYIKPLKTSDMDTKSD